MVGVGRKITVERDTQDPRRNQCTYGGSKGANTELCETFFQELEDCEEKYVDQEGIYCTVRL